MKYSFKQQDMNNWKGRITESLTRFYIRDVLCPKLEKEGWFKVLFLPSIHCMHALAREKRRISVSLSCKLFLNAEFSLGRKRFSK